jgi:hypothetical protein
MFDGFALLADGGVLRPVREDYTIKDIDVDFDTNERRSDLSNEPPQNCSLVHVHAGRVFTNDTADPMKGVHSAINDAQDFESADNAGTIDLSKVLPVGDEIIGYSTFAKDYLVIWLRAHVVVYFWPETLANSTLQQIIPIGCISKYGPDAVGNDIMFPSQSGVKSLKYSVVNQSLNTGDPTKLVDPLYIQLTEKFTTTDNVICKFYERLNHYYILAPFEGGHEILVYSALVKNVVGRYTGLTGYHMFTRDNGDIYLCSEGFVYKMDCGKDDAGTAIDFEWTHSVYYFGSKKYQHAPKEFEVTAEHDADITLTYSYRYWYAMRS